MHTYMHTYIHIHTYDKQHTYYNSTYTAAPLRFYLRPAAPLLPAAPIHTHIHTYIQTDRHTHTDLSIHPSMHTYMNTHRHTYTHAYIHTTRSHFGSSVQRPLPSSDGGGVSRVRRGRDAFLHPARREPPPAGAGERSRGGNVVAETFCHCVSLSSRSIVTKTQTTAGRTP